MVAIRVKGNCPGIGVEAQGRAGDLIVQGHGIVYRGLLLPKVLRSGLAILHHRHGAVCQALQGCFADCSLGDQHAVSRRIILMIFYSFDPVAVIKPKRRHDRVPLFQLIQFIRGNRKCISSFAGEDLARQILPALVIAGLGLGGTARANTNTAPISPVSIPGIPRNFHGDRCTGRGEALLHDLEAVCFAGVTDHILPLSRLVIVIEDH